MLTIFEKNTLNVHANTIKNTKDISFFFHLIICNLSLIFNQSINRKKIYYYLLVLPQLPKKKKKDTETIVRPTKT